MHEQKTKNELHQRKRIKTIKASRKKTATPVFFVCARSSRKHVYVILTPLNPTFI